MRSAVVVMCILSVSTLTLALMLPHTTVNGAVLAQPNIATGVKLEKRGMIKDAVMKVFSLFKHIFKNFRHKSIAKHVAEQQQQQQQQQQQSQQQQQHRRRSLFNSREEQLQRLNMHERPRDQHSTQTYLDRRGFFPSGLADKVTDYLIHEKREMNVRQLREREFDVEFDGLD